MNPLFYAVVLPIAGAFGLLLWRAFLRACGWGTRSVQRTMKAAFIEGVNEVLIPQVKEIHDRINDHMAIEEAEREAQMMTVSGISSELEYHSTKLNSIDDRLSTIESRSRQTRKEDTDE